MIKHDEKVLQELFNEYVTTNPDAGVGIIDQDSTIDIMREYLAHMIRWRTMDETPEIGNRIEVLERNEYGDPITYNMIFNNEIPDIARGWRPSPLGELPEVGDVA